MQKTQLKYTYSDYLLLLEEDRRDLIDGVFYVVPSPNFRHQSVVFNLAMLLGDFVKRNRLGWLRFAPLDVVFSQYDVVQPDLLFTSHENRDAITDNYISAAPDLAIEVLSPSTQDRDKELKLKLYAENGVQEYWIVDPVAESVQVHELSAGEGESIRTYREGIVRSMVVSGFEIAESVRVLQLGSESYDDVTYASGSLSSSVLEGLSLDLSRSFSDD